MKKNSKLEAKTLKQSVLFSLAFAISGILFGIILSSNYILFDGIFTLIGFLISYITLRLSVFVSKKDHIKFPYGKEAIEPIVILLSYSITLYFIIVSLFDAIDIILNGGQDIVLGITIIYLGISSIFAYLSYKKVKAASLIANSVLLDTEKDAWKITVIMTIGAFIGYVIAQVLIWFSFDNISYYVDPIILLLIIILVIKTPILAIVDSFKEIIGMSNKYADYIIQIKYQMKYMGAKYGVKKTYCRVTKMGSVLYIEVDFFVDSNYKYDSITEQDNVRDEIEKYLEWLPYEKWLSVSFTAQKKYAQ